MLGVLAMGYAALSFAADLNYPGYYAVLPSLGAAAVMAAGERSLVGRVLSLGPNVLLGKMSYSLYLWHWPIIVFYGYYAGVKDLSTSEKLSLISCSLGNRIYVLALHRTASATPARSSATSHRLWGHGRQYRRLPGSGCGRERRPLLAATQRPSFARQ